MSADAVRPFSPARNRPEVEAAYLAVPDTDVAEILGGELLVTPRPAPAHTRVASRLGRILGPFDDDPGDPGGWILLDEPPLELGIRPDRPAPDLAGWRRDRLTEKPAGAVITVAPDWVCEVLSDRTRRIGAIELDLAQLWAW